MSACAIKQWGRGTPCVKTDTPAAKEMAAKLAQMQAERDRQDGMWTQPAEEKTPAKPAQGSGVNSIGY
jgi:hypothetical protein